MLKSEGLLLYFILTETDVLSLLYVILSTIYSFSNFEQFVNENAIIKKIKEKR